MKRVIGITGISGLIGKTLSNRFSQLGFEIKPLSRNFNQKDVGECDIIINLAGASINQRWTKKNREIILKSRVETTKKIKEYIKKCGTKRPSLLISASAVGIYPDSDGSEATPHFYDEYSIVKADNFLAGVCESWEQEALELKSDIRVAIIRLGVVLTPKGGALPKMALPFRLGVAGTIGSGLQPFPWVSLEDLERAVEFIINNDELKGVFNITSPIFANNRDLTNVLAACYKSFIKLRIPLFAIRTILGESSMLVTRGQYVSPKRLLEYGFEFKTRKLSESVI